MRALYAFCRLSDDIADCSKANAEGALAAWRRKALAPAPPPDNLVAVAWAATRFRYRIPQRYAEQIIDGVRRDLCQKRYRTFEDVAAYAYGVASTVGLMSMHIIGFAGEQAIPYAIELGVALQLTNILRDAREDWRSGRLYLPMDELAIYGLTEADLDKGQVDDRWRAFLRFQIERNRRLYAGANPGIALLSKDGRFAVSAASELYRAILSDIEAHDYDVFGHRAHISAWGKVRRLSGIWWRNHQAYHLCLQRFVGRNFYHFLDYFSLQNLPLLFKLKALVNHYDNIGHYFQDLHLKAAFTFQNMYLGLSPFDAPATYSLVQYTELADGVWLPVGGIYRVIESLARVAETQGVRFMYSAPVKQIEVDGDRATGVVLQDGSFFGADVIVANADLPYVYSQLLPDEVEAHHLERLQYTCSAIMFYWGVDTVYRQLGTHNVFLVDDYRTSFDRIFKEHLLPDEPSFYVHAPARTDPSAAPVGEDTLTVLVPAGHLDEGLAQDWDALQARARSAVIHRLAASAGIVDLEQHLKFEMSYTPRDWFSMYNLAKGSAFGLSHNFMQVGYLRPHNRHHRYGNLYFVGSSTHPGTGRPMVLLSARLTTERILKELGVTYPALNLRPALAV